MQRFLERKYCSVKCAARGTIKQRAADPKRNRKISLAHRGKIVSLETRRKLSRSLRASPKARRLQFKKGKRNPAYGTSNKGAKNHGWKGGSSWYWKRWILKRDNYTCRKCGFRDPEIMELDHIIPKVARRDLELSPKNMQTLCPNCHAKKTLRDRKKYKQKFLVTSYRRRKRDRVYIRKAVRLTHKLTMKLAKELERRA